MVDQITGGAISEYTWACGKCHSPGLYRDDDRAAGDFSIACRFCGNRYYDGFLSNRIGIPPVKIQRSSTISSSSAIIKKNIIEQQIPTQSCNVSGSNDLNEKTDKKETPMGQQGICVNCGRDITIIARGLCNLCFNAGKRLQGEERKAALEKEAFRIKLGKIRRKRTSSKLPPSQHHSTSPKSEQEQPSFDHPAIDKIKPETTSSASVGMAGTPEIPVLINDLHCTMIILSNQELRFIEALRAGRIAIVM